MNKILTTNFVGTRLFESTNEVAVYFEHFIDGVRYESHFQREAARIEESESLQSLVALTVYDSDMLEAAELCTEGLAYAYELALAQHFSHLSFDELKAALLA